MKKQTVKQEAKQTIDEFFRRENFKSEEVKKIKRLAMKFNIKLGVYRKLFCKKCLSKLKGRIRIKKNYKTIECTNCGYKNKSGLV